jgi:hypothetical protein
MLTNEANFRSILGTILGFFWLQFFYLITGLFFFYTLTKVFIADEGE